MSVGFGIEPLVENGIVTSGTSSQDIRKIWGALFSEGVVDGCEITLSSTGLSYTIGEGVVVVQVGTGEKVLCYVPKTTLTTGPVTASRYDTFYIKQNIPGTTNNVEVGVNQGLDIPSNSVQLGRVSLPANATRTSAGTIMNRTPYSIPYGANLGTFFTHTDTANSVVPKTTRTGATGTVNLPTDRRLTVTIDANLSAVRSDQSTPAYRFDDAAYCELIFEIHINGTKRAQFCTPGLHQSWSTYHFEESWMMPMDEYTISYKTRYPANMPGYARRHYSGTDLATGITFAVKDGGVIL